MISTPNKILVAQTLFLGDVIVTLPIISRLKERYPQAIIDVLVGEGAEEALRNQASVNSVLIYKKHSEGKGIAGIFTLAKLLKKQKYDIAIVLPGSVRTALAVYLAGIPQRIGTNQSTGINLFIDQVKYPREAWRIPGGNIIRFLDNVWNMVGGKDSFVSTLYTDVVRLDSSLNVFERNLQLLEPLGVSFKGYFGYVPLTPSQKNYDTADRLLSSKQGDTIIAVAPGSSWKTKQWLSENYINVIKRLTGENIRVVLIGGKGDAEICRNITDTVNSKLILNACGTLSVLESAALLRKCKLLLTNDSAAMHIAASMGVPCIIILGPTVKEFGFIPNDARNAIAEVDGLWCRPCTPFGGNQCPTGTFDCMKGISVDKVFDAVMKGIH